MIFTDGSLPSDLRQRSDIEGDRGAHGGGAILAANSRAAHNGAAKNAGFT